MDALIRRGPMTIVLVFSPTCPHCHTYMPLWNKMCKMKGRRSNMISVKSDVYQQTPMSEKKPVSGVPTVLFVDKDGKISEAKEPRNQTVMTNAAKLGVSEQVAATATASGTAASDPISAPNSSNLFRRTSSERAAPASAGSLAAPAKLVVPGLPAGTSMSENPLRIIPGTPVSSESANINVQRGGDPFTAFMLAAQQAGPAALLLGAYSTLKKKNPRSSGLPAVTRRRRFRSRRSTYRR
jgi:thiol-disulfide isomerase/thioredoxin